MSPDPLGQSPEAQTLDVDLDTRFPGFLFWNFYFLVLDFLFYVFWILGLGIWIFRCWVVGAEAPHRTIENLISISGPPQPSHPHEHS